MTRVLVTGGAGFIGSHIVDALLAERSQVEVLDDLSSGSRDNLPANVRLYELDIRSPAARDAVSAAQPDIIVHAAAQISVRVSMEDPVFDTQVNLVGLVSLLQAFQGRKLPHIVFISTGGAIYGEQDSFPAPETHPIRPCSVYGLAKHTSEMYLELWARQFGLRFCALRLSNVYGPRQNPHGEAGVVAIFCQRLLNDKEALINGSGEQTRDFVYVKDVANAVKLACAKKMTGTYNIGTAQETSVNKLYEIICKALELKRAPLHGEVRSGEQLRSCIDYSLAARQLGWKPMVDISEGLRQTALWFKAAHSSI